MASEISAEELKQQLDDQEDIVLVDVLTSQSYQAQHIPGAINVPFSGDNFIDELKQAADINKNSRIIVYCSGPTCQTSPRAAAKLEEAGFSNVIHFKGGLAGWQEAGFEFDSEA